MQMIEGQSVSPHNMPGPIGFGFGSGHSPTAAAAMMNSSGPVPDYQHGETDSYPPGRQVFTHG